MSTIAAVIGRVLVALLFIVSGIAKLADPGPVAAMIERAGMSPALTVPVALFEVVVGIALAIGLMSRLAALALAAFTVMTILLYHNQFTDPTQRSVILLHIALVGGLLGLFAHSQIRWSYDSLRGRRAEAEADRLRDADERAHDAELRAARAEGRIAAVHSDVVHTDPVVDPPVTPRRRWF